MSVHSRLASCRLRWRYRPHAGQRRPARGLALLFLVVAIAHVALRPADPAGQPVPFDVAPVAARAFA